MSGLFNINYLDSISRLDSLFPQTVLSKYGKRNKI